MGDRIDIKVEDTTQVVPPTSRKVFVAVDENGMRIGETHPNAKLTDAQVDEIRDLRENHGWTRAQLAAHFNIPPITAQKIYEYARRASSIAGWKVILLHTPISTITPKEEHHEHPAPASHQPA